MVQSMARPTFGNGYLEPGSRSAELWERAKQSLPGGNSRTTVFSAPYIHRPTGTVVNLSVDKELIAFGGARNRLSARFDVNNLFDGANEVYWSYPGQGRNFYVGLRYDY